MVPRTTSTCVESTIVMSRVTSRAPDHLHVRGEHVTYGDHGWHAHGPPPRAWRAPALAGCPRAICRTTSTCVESTLARRSKLRSLSDHLHVRGEHQ